MIITRRAVTAALSWTGVAALIGLSPFRLITEVLATGTTDNVAEPVSLPEVALGPADAAVTMTEYASITCPHCAAFNENVFPKIRAAYIDTGKIRYVFHEFPLDPVAAASSVLSRCIAKGDSEKYFAVTDLLFRQPWAKVTKPRETLNLVGKQTGLDEEQVGACLKDDVLFNKIVAERTFATAKLGINATPTFLINGDKIVGETPFEEFDRRIKALLKN
ncbi:DsbA family protein [Bradyrhizobium sp.]|uniref:DsbA family protein n=1 Tax=Bradyrhizobium sp. TaxID=376 RepID=UPI003C29B902